MLCKKLNLSSSVRQELIQVSENIYKEVFLKETFGDIHYYAVEADNGYSFTHDGTKNPSKSLNVVDWKYLLGKQVINDTFLSKYKLYPRYTSITSHNFNFHRHTYNNECPWILSIIHNQSGYLKLGKLDIDPFFDFEYAKTFESITEYDETDKPIKILEEYYSQPGDIFLFNSWIFHTFITNDSNPRSATFNPIVNNPDEYIDYIESL